MSSCIARAAMLGALSLLAPGTASSQQEYPVKPIRFIVPYAPGGSTTWTSRLIGQRLTEAWGQQVIIDNRPGGNTIIGTQAAVRSRPDGYTLLYIGSALASNHTLINAPYDAQKDIAPIATVSSYENLMAVTPTLPVKNVREFVALAKRRPGEINYATSSHGGATHLAGVLLNMVAGIKTEPVNYKGGGPAVVDVMGGQVQYIMAVPVNIASQVKGGRLRALAVTGDKRLKIFPSVPTFAEEGLPQVTLKSWQGVAAPAGTPNPVLNQIAAEVEKLVAAQDSREKIEAEGFVPFYNNPEKTTQLIKADIVRYAKIIKAGNIKVE